MKYRLVKAAGFVLSLLLIAGNVSAQKHYTKDLPKEQEVSSTKGPSPGNDYVWKTGNWRWVDGRYAWNPGSWDKPPFADARWIAGRWINTRSGWYWVNSRWDRRQKE